MKNIFQLLIWVENQVFFFPIFDQSLEYGFIFPDFLRKKIESQKNGYPDSIQNPIICVTTESIHAKFCLDQGISPVLTSFCLGFSPFFPDKMKKPLFSGCSVIKNPANAKKENRNEESRMRISPKVPIHPTKTPQTR